MTADPSARAVLESFRLEPRTTERLATYLAHLARWNQRLNLTGLTTAEARARVLIGDVLPALARIPPGRLIDVGSGNGSPGLVFAAARDDLSVTLLEPRHKRWAFLRDAARAMGRPGIDVRRQRHDEYDGPPAESVVVRALRLPLDELAALVGPGGQVLVFGEQPLAGAAFVQEPTPGLPCHAFRRCST